jgi:hypothetical protein
MRRMLERSFDVQAAPSAASRVLVDAVDWPTWAPHLRRVEVTPPGPVGPSSRATLRLANGTSAKVAVTEFEDRRRFRWEGSFLWLGLGYDHVVEPRGQGSRITFRVDGWGCGLSTLGRLFARVYARKP